MGEKLLYLIFGTCTTGISIGSFVLLNEVFGVEALLANVLSWILAVSFAYVTNRIWVFQSKTCGKSILKEMVSFFSGRLVSLGLEEVLLFVFVTCLDWNGTVVKLGAQVIVFLSNYGFSKWVVFKKSV